MALDVFAADQLHHQDLVHQGDGQGVEGVQALDRWEMGRPDPALHQALVAVKRVLHPEANRIAKNVRDFPEATGGSTSPYRFSDGSVAYFALEARRGKKLTKSLARP